jgi:hypothetical protein
MTAHEWTNQSKQSFASGDPCYGYGRAYRVINAAALYSLLVAISASCVHSMPLQTCPTTRIQAPSERVWHLLISPSELQRWSGAKIVKAPSRPLTTGDQILFRAGLGGLFQVGFQVVDLEPLRHLGLEVHLPFGVVNHEVVVITSESTSACRVTYN